MCPPGFSLAIKTPSIYANANGNPRVTWLIKGWMFYATFRSPSGMRVNSNKPNRVVMTVFGMSSATAGT